ncbi:hypothetical protein A2159_02360 [Candidatus Woesebacteria bacterium RBG_13_34_9]|uniref:Aspartate racemase n=1 Tax=Candidatus Woesebacteria bacterium RBG_13_34_9 TaxID=1802477 RepID=A0A1F7X176_9BACT|nr:MAG: hypothetical protein A2159_02360 [Candidatus Woesebacteria bacterium RBG_13_34_9]
MKKAGIIGGLGPETTSKFYMEVVFACSKITGKPPNIIVSNVGIPLDVEEEVVVNAKNKEMLLPLLTNSAQQLEKAGADFIVVPCNTAHVFIDKIRKSVRIPVLSIIEETSDFLKSKDIKRVGLLGTRLTINEKLFDEKLKENGIEIIIPNDSNQSKMGLLINRLLRNSHNKKDKKELLRIIDELVAKNIDCILLACTDLQLLVRNHNKVKIFDTLDLLTKATVREVVDISTPKPT